MINHLLQDATIWRTTPNGSGGYTFSAPEKVKCRWVDQNELIPGSETVVSKAIVYLNVDVTTDDYFLLGKSSDANPTLLANTYRVSSFKKVPNLRTLEILRKAWLN